MLLKYKYPKLGYFDMFKMYSRGLTMKNPEIDDFFRTYYKLVGGSILVWIAIAILFVAGYFLQEKGNAKPHQP
jgi:predicted metal-binding membrane protein